MKHKILLATVVAALGSAHAFAADLAPSAPTPSAYTKAPAMVNAAYNWSGFYVGATIGARTSDAKWSSLSEVDGIASDTILAPPNSTDLGNTSARLGGYLGYNWQVASLVVVGLEGDIAWANNDSTHAGFPGLPPFPNNFPGDLGSDPTTDSARVKLGWDGSIRGRVGFLVAPNWMIYGTGGAAWQQVEATSLCNSARGSRSFCDPGIFSGTTTGTKAGWTAGGGIETLLTPHVALRAEYRFSDFGHISNRLPNAPEAGLVSDISIRTNIANVGIAYKF